MPLRKQPVVSFILGNRIEIIMEKASLILTTYNLKENFLKTYKSIRQQDYPDIEIVVADGGSTDGTAEEIRKCAGREAGRALNMPCFSRHFICFLLYFFYKQDHIEIKEFLSK